MLKPGGFAHAAQPSIALIGAICAIMTFGTLVRAQDTDLTSPSPAEGHAQVVAQGMAAPAADRVAWRAVERTIPIRRDAVPSNRFADGAGFLVATGGPLFVTDQKTKVRLRLAKGEATFVPQGGNQTWASLSDKKTKAATLELVARDQVNEVESEKLIDHSRSFAMPQGDYDLDLVRDSIGRNEISEVANGEFPLYLFVIEGNLEVRDNGGKGERVRLSAGEAAPFAGDIAVRGRSDDGATFVAGIIGPTIGGGSVASSPAATAEPSPTAPPAPTKTPKPKATKTPAPPASTDNAALTLDIRVCPAGMRPATLDANACGGLDGGYDLQLVRADGLTLGIADAPLVAPHTIRWSDLVSSTYELLITQVPAGYDTAALDGYVCCTPAGGFTLIVAPGAQLYGTLTFFQPAAVAAAPAPVQQGPPPGSDTVDSDLDGLTDQQEINIYGTNPYVADTDGDGVIDSNEIGAGTNPFDPQSYP